MSHLALSVLGSLRIERNDAPARLESDKVRALLIYLTVNAIRSHRRDALACLLWPELPERSARHNLSQALFNLRQAIRDHEAEPPFLLISRDAVQFNPASDYWLDVDAFTALIAECHRHAHRAIETCAPCARRLAQATALYRGDFLAEFALADSVAFEEWALLEREQYRRRMMDALTTLAAYHERRSAYDQSCEYVRRQLAIDPWNEEAHRHLMRVLMLAGQRNAALAQYERCRQALAEGLNVEPEEETTALYRSIMDGEVTPGAAEALALPAPHPHNLPPQPTPFIGREDELAQLADLLSNPACRLLTIIGLGGVGKTRLALQVAVEQIEAFADGVYFVPLAVLNQPEHLASAIADALDLPPSSEPAESRILSALRDKEVLLVLDNLEHLLSQVDLLAMILQQAPRVTIVATSRERLNLQGEWLFELGGLKVPTDETIDRRSSAVDLFLQSARRVGHTAPLTPADLTAIVHICRLVDGLPLAIELAASWIRLLCCAEILQEINHNIGFLATSLRDVPARHRSLQAVFDNSWRLLTGDERSALRRLSVFCGGFRREAAEAVADVSLSHLAALIDKSLLRRSITGRYDLHELVRQYAARHLRAAAEEDMTRDRHLSTMLELAEQAETELIGSDQEAWLARLEEERDNMRAALQWALERGDAERALRLSGALWRFWDIHGHLGEGRDSLEQALALPGGEAASASRLKALNGAGTLARRQSDYTRSKELFEAGVALSRAAGDTFWTGVLLNGLGLLARRQGDVARASALFEESLGLSRASSNHRGELIALGNLGSIARVQGDLQRAAAIQEECLALSRKLADKRGVAEDLNNLAVVLDALGNLQRATTLQQESLALYRSLGDRYGVALLLYNLGARAAHTGQIERARANLAESLSIYQRLGEIVGCIECLEQFATVAIAQGRSDQAVRLLSVSEQQRRLLGDTRTPPMQSDYERALETARCRVDPVASEVAWAEGQVMTLDETIDDVLASRPESVD